MRRFFCQHQVISKIKIKKGLHPNSISFPDQVQMRSRKKELHFSGPNNSKSFTTSARQFHWGAIFIFGAKTGLKSTKNVVFCILFRPIGGCSPAPLATLLVDTIAELLLNYTVLHYRITPIRMRFHSSRCLKLSVVVLQELHTKT